MSIKLFNHTRYPDAPIKTVLTTAARLIGVRGDVAVKVTVSKLIRPDGYAKHAVPYLWHLQGGPKKKNGKNSHLIHTPLGYVLLSLPRGPLSESVVMLAAEHFFDVAMHEMAHIKDFRQGTLRRDPKTKSGRRIAHKDRPCEIDADNMVYDAMQKRGSAKRRQELSRSLADVMAGKISVEAPDAPLTQKEEIL